MIKKLFAEKDATIYSDYPFLNSGLDSILEISRKSSFEFSDEGSISRFIIKFSTSEINDTINNSIGTGSFKAYLKLFVADTNELPRDYTLISYAISGSWDVGTGKFKDIPYSTDGVGWIYRTYNTSSAWSISSFSPSVTSSFSPLNPGGGNWYTSSFSTQSFGIYNDKDILLDVTNIVNSWYSSSINNNGIIIMLSGSEFIRNDYFSLKYFSRDTNTIYAPVLEMRWDDSIYLAPTASILLSEDMIVVIDNNKVEYNNSEVKRFRLSVRDKYPTRSFTTSSLYTVPKFLPSGSYYAIKDLDTDNYVINFDQQYSKISSDTVSNFFDIDMNGLEPERYYKILIKSKFNNRTFVYDNQYYFKVRK